MDVIASGSAQKARFTLTPRHEVQRLDGLAPPLPRAVVATFRAGGMNGLGEAPPDQGFPVFPLVVYGVLIGLMVGTVHARRRG